MDPTAPGYGLIKRAIILENEQRYINSLACYQEGLDILIQVLNTAPSNKNQLRQQVNTFLARAEEVKIKVQKLKDGRKNHQLQILEDSTHHTYDSIFNKYLDADVTIIKIEDPYIRQFHQCQNLMMFSALAVKYCPKLTQINLITGASPKIKEQETYFNEMKQNLLLHKVTLTVTFSTSLHDRQIILNNGWTIKIGRGLDIFKRPLGRLSLCSVDNDFRRCNETTIDILHEDNTKKIYQ